MESTNFLLHTPEEKLRKISFDASQIDEFPIILNKNCQEMKVDGWGNENWDLKTEQIINKPKSRRSLSKNENEKDSQKKIKQFTKKQIPVNNRTTRYIAKIQQKLIELGEIMTQKSNKSMRKNQLQKQKNVANTIYLTPQKNQNHKTSKSQSDCYKSEHNFTSTMYKRSKDKHRTFSIRRRSQEISQHKNLDTIDEPNIQQINSRSIYERYQRQSLLPQTERKSSQCEQRTYQNKSMMESYQDFTKRTRQVLMISYPVIDQKRKSHQPQKLKKLNQYFQRFQSQHTNYQRFKYIGLSKNKKTKTNQNNQEQPAFHIKITEPLQSKNRKKSLRRVERVHL